MSPDPDPERAALLAQLLTLAPPAIHAAALNAPTATIRALVRAYGRAATPTATPNSQNGNTP